MVACWQVHHAGMLLRTGRRFVCFSWFKMFAWPSCNLVALPGVSCRFSCIFCTFVSMGVGIWLFGSHPCPQGKGRRHEQLVGQSGQLSRAIWFPWVAIELGCSTVSVQSLFQGLVQGVLIPSLFGSVCHAWFGVCFWPWVGFWRWRHLAWSANGRGCIGKGEGGIAGRPSGMVSIGCRGGWGQGVGLCVRGRCMGRFRCDLSARGVGLLCWEIDGWCNVPPFRLDGRAGDGAWRWCCALWRWGWLWWC